MEKQLEIEQLKKEQARNRIQEMLDQINDLWILIQIVEIIENVMKS